MSAMDHKPGHGGDDCLYCCEPWPCPVGKARQELADYLRNQPDHLEGDSYPYNCGHDAGRLAAADTIDI